MEKHFTKHICISDTNQYPASSCDFTWKENIANGEDFFILEIQSDATGRTYCNIFCRNQSYHINDKNSECLLPCAIQGCIHGVCLAVMTDPFAPQVLSIKADNTSNVVTAGLWCGCFGTGSSLYFPSNVAYYYETTTLLPCENSTCVVTWNNPRFWTLEIDIASNARVSEFPPLAVPTPMLSESHILPRTRRSCFVIFRLMARGQSPITIVSFCSFELILFAVYTY